MIKVLSTKTLDESALKHAAELNMAVRCMDFIRTEPVPVDTRDIDWDKHEALVFTSSNAVRYFFEAIGNTKIPSDKIIFSLSGKTALEFKEFGAEATYKAINSSSLADAIIAIKAVKSVLHVCGNIKLGTIQTRLEAAGIVYTPLTVYNTHYLEVPSMKQGHDAIMFYSPSGVESFLRRNSLDGEMVYCCIGETTAETLRDKWSQVKVLVAREPSPNSMLEAIGKYFEGRQIGTWPS